MNVEFDIFPFHRDSCLRDKGVGEDEKRPHAICEKLVLSSKPAHGLNNMGFVGITKQVN